MRCLTEPPYRLAAEARYLAISRCISAGGGSAARPWSRSATQCDCASASGMVAPIGWMSPMKYRPGTAGGTTRWYRRGSVSSAPVRPLGRNGKLIL
jgi:hypothetical protein